MCGLCVCSDSRSAVVGASDRHHGRLGDDRVDGPGDGRRPAGDAVRRGAPRRPAADVVARRQSAGAHRRLPGDGTEHQLVLLHTRRRRERRGRRILARVCRTGPTDATQKYASFFLIFIIIITVNSIFLFCLLTGIDKAVHKHISGKQIKKLIKRLNKINKQVKNTVILQCFMNE